MSEGRKTVRQRDIQDLVQEFMRSMDQSGIAIGRALPIIFEHPPVTPDATGFTCAAISKLYEELKASGTSIFALSFLNGLHTGLNQSRTAGGSDPSSTGGTQPH